MLRTLFQGLKSRKDPPPAAPVLHEVPAPDVPAGAVPVPDLPADLPTDPYQASQEVERRGDVAGAEAILRAHMHANPDDFLVPASLAAFLVRHENYVAAQAVLAPALARFPAAAPLLLNHGLVLQSDMQIDAAIQAFRRAIAAEPTMAAARFLLATKLFLKGEYPEGFLLLRARDHLHSGTPPFWVTQVPRWQGESLTGKRLLTWLDWGGLGDEIQFARYLLLVKERHPDAVICLGCSNESLRLLTQLPAADETFSAVGDVKADYQIPLLDLPCVFETTVASVPLPGRYLAAIDADRQAWADRLAGSPGLKVGLCWSSGFWGSTVRSPKSIPLELLAPLAQLPGVRLISLQKGPAHADLAASGLAIEDYDPHLKDLADTAALIENLDLVVSVDTAVAHLAGALGKPVVMLLKYESGTFWLLDTENSPWYASMRIVRQPRAGDWADVASRAIDLVRHWPDRPPL